MFPESSEDREDRENVLVVGWVEYGQSEESKEATAMKAKKRTGICAKGL